MAYCDFCREYYDFDATHFDDPKHLSLTESYLELLPLLNGHCHYHGYCEPDSLEYFRHILRTHSSFFQCCGVDYITLDNFATHIHRDHGRISTSHQGGTHH